MLLNHLTHFFSRLHRKQLSNCWEICINAARQHVGNEQRLKGSSSAATTPQAGNVPVPVIRIAVRQERGDRFRCLLVGEDIPQAVTSQHQNIIRSVLVLRQRVDPDLNKDNEQKLNDGRCVCIEIFVFSSK